MREGRWHKNNLPREILLVPPRRQLGGRGADFHAFVPTTYSLTKSALPCNNGMNGYVLVLF